MRFKTVIEPFKIRTVEIWKRRDDVRGLKITDEAPFLRHFTAQLEPIA